MRLSTSAEEVEEVEVEEGQGDEPVVVAEAAPPASERNELETHPWYKPSSSRCPGGSTTPRAASALRALELLLLMLCLATPPLGALLRASLSPSSASGSAEPLSWFSMTLFALLASFRPLREFKMRTAAHTSTLHALVHSASSPSLSSFASSVQVQEERGALSTRLARLEAQVAAYVDDALAPVEKGVRRVERRVDKLRARQGVPLLKTAVGEKEQTGSRTNTNTNTVHLLLVLLRRCLALAFWPLLVPVHVRAALHFIT
ncbi:hypothetical protein FB451DRAFT_1417348 [Mycena latifolia]|nr:hypothetical protein FB451DRAFT_1417348 [Mycena latifolia]